MPESRDASPALQQALYPIAGQAGYRYLLTTMYSDAVLRAAGMPAATRKRLAAYREAHGVEALPRSETLLESDSKSQIYVVQPTLEGTTGGALVVKWYPGARQPQARIEQQMNAYFQGCLTSRCRIGPVLEVLPLQTTSQTPLSIAILPYLGATTLYDHLHDVSPHSTTVEALLRQAAVTLAYVQVFGQLGHANKSIHLTALEPQQATDYFLRQVDTVVMDTFAASGTPIAHADTFLEHFTYFARILGEDSCKAGLYYRGINPRNIMWTGAEQIEIDFEQDTSRSRFIDIVSLLENGLEMTDWDKTVDYPSFQEGQPFLAWDQQRRQASKSLTQYNCLSHEQIEALLTAYLDTTAELEQRYLSPVRALYSARERRLLWHTARLFRHLQYVGYCKRNELQAQTVSKRLSSRYRQHLHAVWAKCALDSLLYPLTPEDDCLPAEARAQAMALRQSLDALPLPSVFMI